MRTLFIFFFKIFEFILGAMFRSLFPRKTYRNNYRTLSNIDKIKYLEKRRQYKGYHKGWLYHRCKEEGLLKEYNKFYRPDKEHPEVNNTYIDYQIRFTFGKYKGRLVGEIWKLDKGYIDWVRDNVDLSEYPDEELAFEELFNAELL